MSDDKKGKISVVGGIEFSWLLAWYSYADSDRDPYGDLYGGLALDGTPPKKWAPKNPRQMGSKKIRKRDLVFVLQSIYQENESAIPEAVWDARQELEREIMALSESAL